MSNFLSLFNALLWVKNVSLWAKFNKELYNSRGYNKTWDVKFSVTFYRGKMRVFGIVL